MYVSKCARVLLSSIPLHHITNFFQLYAMAPSDIDPRRGPAILGPCRYSKGNAAMYANFSQQQWHKSVVRHSPRILRLRFRLIYPTSLLHRRLPLRLRLRCRRSMGS